MLTAGALVLCAVCAVCAVLLLFVCAVNVCVVKQRPVVLPPKPEPVVWVVGTDNSPHAKHALDTTLELMGNGDVLHVFCATTIHSQRACPGPIKLSTASQLASISSLETVVVLLFACVFARSVFCLLSSGVVLVFSQLTTTTTNRRGQV